MENDALKRYYRGETTLEEERELKAMSGKGVLPDEPMLSFGRGQEELPAELNESIYRAIKSRQKQQIHSRILILGTIAAMLILIVSIRSLLPGNSPALQLSDNLKKERFENALRIIGNVLEEKNTQPKKVIYEDNKLIISIE